jgi:hypothetical protein
MQAKMGAYNSIQKYVQFRIIQMTMIVSHTLALQVTTFFVVILANNMHRDEMKCNGPHPISNGPKFTSRASVNQKMFAGANTSLHYGFTRIPQSSYRRIGNIPNFDMLMLARSVVERQPGNVVLSSHDFKKNAMTLSSCNVSTLYDSFSLAVCLYNISSTIWYTNHLLAN